MRSSEEEHSTHNELSSIGRVGREAGRGGWTRGVREPEMSGKGRAGPQLYRIL